MSERMNKEQAKNILKDFNKQIKDYGEDLMPEEKELSQALDIAIESLDNEWVDVRDRLPSDDEIAENYGKFEITYFDTIFKHQVTIAEFCKSNKYAIVEKDERGYWYDWEDDEIINVIAWRPLPKPYERKEQ